MSHFMDKKCFKLYEDVYVVSEDRSVMTPGGPDDTDDNTEVVKDITEDNGGSNDNNLLEQTEV